MVENSAKKAKRQTNNVILEKEDSNLSKEQIFKQAGKIFNYNHTNFIERVIIIADDEIRIYERV